METKQAKSFEECCDEVEKLRSLSMSESWLCSYFKEAAELYNQETAAERDRLKEELKEQNFLHFEKNRVIKKLTNERDSLKEENERLKKDYEWMKLEAFDKLAQRKKVEGECDSLKQLNSELVEGIESILRTPHIGNVYEKAKELISKVNQQKDKTMKELTPLAKQFFKEFTGIEYDPSLKGMNTATEFAIKAAAFCSEKIRRAIELARKFKQ